MQLTPPAKPFARPLRLLLAAFAASVLFVLASTTVSAATINVTNTNDSGAGSLRQAITDAASGDTIDLTGISGTITLASQLAISKNLTINGPGAATLVISGNNATRVFIITAGTVNISDLTVADADSGSSGGGFQLSGGSTTTVTRVTVRDNEGVGGGAFLLGSATLNVIESTLSNNTSTGVGGAIHSSGSSTVTILNSTLSGNTAASKGGAIKIDGGTTVSILNSTIVNNDSPDGGGLKHDQGSAAISGFTAANTIIANNTATSTDCKGGAADAIFTSDNNLDSDGSCGFEGSGDLSGVDPLLGPLADNGGPTFTHALLSGSPALDAGKDSAAPPTDQRGTSRPRGSASDIGAFELIVVSASVPGLTTWGLAALAALLGVAVLASRRRVARSRA